MCACEIIVCDHTDHVGNSTIIDWMNTQVIIMTQTEKFQDSQMFWSINS